MKTPLPYLNNLAKNLAKSEVQRIGLLLQQTVTLLSALQTSFHRRLSPENTIFLHNCNITHEIEITHIRDGKTAMRSLPPPDILITNIQLSVMLGKSSEETMERFLVANLLRYGSRTLQLKRQDCGVAFAHAIGQYV